MACKKDNSTVDNQTEIINSSTDKDVKLLWTSSISDDGLTGGTFYNQVYNDKLYVSGSKNGQAVIMAKDVNTGETQWEWSDWNEELQSVSIRHPYLTDDNRFLAFSGLNYYDINTTDGSTNFKEYADYFSFVFNTVVFGNSLYHVGISQQSEEDNILQAVYKRNLNTQELEEYLVPNYTGLTKSPFGEVGNIVRFSGFEYEGKSKLLLSIMEIDSTWHSKSYISLYDIESESWDYEMAELDYEFRENYSGSPIISGDYVYHTKGRLAICHNVLTGELIWKQNFGVGTGGEGFVVSEDDNIMVVSTHSGERLTFGLDMTTGDIVWQTETTGNNGQKYVLNGVVYFSSNGDGELHALDIATGAYIWKIESPDNSSNNWFKGVLTGIPGENGEKGKIFANSYLNAFCFEAAR